MTTRRQLELKSARCFALKDYKRALRNLRELLEQVGENPQTLYMMAYCHERLADLDPALTYAQRAVQADPEHLEALQLVSRIHVLREEHEEACESVRKGIEVVAARRAAGQIACTVPATPPRPQRLRRWLEWFRRWRTEPELPDHTPWLDWAEAYLRQHAGDRPDK